MNALELQRTHGKPRSPHWPIARGAWLTMHPRCALCGGNKKLEVHHKRPFHLHPELELDPSNFITLCENKSDGINCHLAFGHLGSFRSFNPDVEGDVATWSKKIAERPGSGNPEGKFGRE